MANRRFKRDWSRPTGPLTSETYRGGRSYPLTPEVEQLAEAAGALEAKRVRSPRRR